jgi:branched-chain amino acid transport system ATP-binding protein
MEVKAAQWERVAREGVAPVQTYTPVLLRATALVKSFGGNRVLNSLSLELRSGEVVLLRGDNGSGKTTLLNILTGNLEPDSGRIELLADATPEEFSFPQPWWKSLNPLSHFTPERLATERVGRSWQGIRLFSTQDLETNIAVAAPGQIGENPLWALLRRREVARQEQVIRRTSRALLCEIGLGGREESSADRVSLGQAKRVAIARAVSAGASILFLDEPLAGLDAEGVDQILHLLKTLAQEKRVTLVIVEHVFHARHILEFATTLWTMSEGGVRIQTTAEGPQAVAKIPVPNAASALIASGRVVNHMPFPGGALFSKIATRESRVGENMLEVRNLVVQRQYRKVIGGTEGLSFDLGQGEVGLLQAPNGWGKTTLLEALAGLISISAGTVRLNGCQLESLPTWARARQGLSLLQARENSFPSLRVSEILRLAHVEEIPADIVSLLSRKLGELSGGQLQRVALASALGTRGALLFLLDEPFSMLDQTAIDNLLARLKLSDTQCALIAIPFINDPWMENNHG